MNGRLAEAAPNSWEEMKLFLKILAALLIIAGLVILFAFASSGPEQQPETSTIDADSVQGDVYKFTDNETGAICYVYEGSVGGGISCLPEEQTNSTTNT